MAGASNNFIPIGRFSIRLVGRMFSFSVPVLIVVAERFVSEGIIQASTKWNDVFDVELRFFAGLSIEQTAAALDISTDIVKREWRTAKLWLRRELGGEA